MQKITDIYKAFLAQSLKRQLQGFALLAAFLIAGAFTVEYGFKAQPCPLCWMQRYGHWAMFGIALLGSLLPHRGQALAMVGVLGTALYGLGYGIYHSLVQAKVIALPATCGAAADMPTSLEGFNEFLKNPTPPASCDEISFAVLGVPLPAWNIIVMAGVLWLIFAIYKHRKQT